MTDATLAPLNSFVKSEALSSDMMLSESKYRDGMIMDVSEYSESSELSE